MNRAALTFHVKSFDYKIPFVDEARGTSIVRMHYSGTFKKTGKSVESNSTA